MVRFSPALVLPLVLAGLALVPAAVGFDGNKAAEGPLRLTIEPIDVVTGPEAPRDFTVTLANEGKSELAVELQLCGLVDECRPVGETRQSVRVPAGGKSTASFGFVCGRGCLSAHYPVRVRAKFAAEGQTRTIEAVQVFRTEFPAATALGAAGDLPPLEVVPQRGALLLATLKTHRVTWSYYDGPLVSLPPGWQGSDPKSSASFSRSKFALGGLWKQTLQMHPPYKPTGGSVFAEYRLKLPPSAPIRLCFANAMRDTGPREPPSDGVTFRVWIGREKLFERHTDAKQWIPGEADLSRFAGREVLLRLESHPGPRHSTTCDSSFWGDPLVVAGPTPPAPTPEERLALARSALEAAESGRASSPSTWPTAPGRPWPWAAVDWPTEPWPFARPAGPWSSTAGPSRSKTSRSARGPPASSAKAPLVPASPQGGCGSSSDCGSTTGRWNWSPSCGPRARGCE